MKYALIFHETQSDFDKRESADAPTYWGSWSAYIDILANENVMILGQGAGLQAPSTATTVRTGGSARQIQDGPVSDTKEQLAGFLLIDVEHLDEAIKWAKLAPCAETGAVEIRPVLPDPS